MVLVDSSVWILARNAAGVRDLVGDEEIATCPPIIEEVLRGVRSEQEYRKTATEFQAMTILDSPMPLETFERAAVIYRAARAGGYTIRSAYDCLIAACAIEHAVSVLHIDRDFANIARFTKLHHRNLGN